MSLFTDNNLKLSDKPKSVVDTVADFLRKSIVNGSLKPGEKIPNNDISNSLGVSIIPFREAIRVLEKEGLVISHRGRGSWVANTSIKDLEETFEMREMMELSAINLIENHVKAGEDIKKKIELLIPGKEVDELGMEFCMNFHRNIIKLARNSKLLYVFDMFLNNIRRYQRLSYTIRHMEGLTADEHFKEHYKFFELLIKGDFDSTRKGINEHLNKLKNLLLKQMEFSE